MSAVWRRWAAGHYATVEPERKRIVVLRNERGEWWRFRFLAPVKSRVGPFKTLAGAKDLGTTEEEE